MVALVIWPFFLKRVDIRKGRRNGRNNAQYPLPRWSPSRPKGVIQLSVTVTAPIVLVRLSTSQTKATTGNGRSRENQVSFDSSGPGRIPTIQGCCDSSGPGRTVRPRTDNLHLKRSLGVTEPFLTEPAAVHPPLLASRPTPYHQLIVLPPWRPFSGVAAQGLQAGLDALANHFTCGRDAGLYVYV